MRREGFTHLPTIRLGERRVNSAKSATCPPSRPGGGCQSGQLARGVGSKPLGSAGSVGEGFRASDPGESVCASMLERSDRPALALLAASRRCPPRRRISGKKREYRVVHSRSGSDHSWILDFCERRERSPRVQSPMDANLAPVARRKEARLRPHRRCTVINADGSGEQLLASLDTNVGPSPNLDRQKIKSSATRSVDETAVTTSSRTSNADGSGTSPSRRPDAFDPAWSPYRTKLAHVAYDWDCGCGEIEVSTSRSAVRRNPRRQSQLGTRRTAPVFGYSRRDRRNGDGPSGSAFPTDSGAEIARCSPRGRPTDQDASAHRRRPRHQRDQPTAPIPVP